MEADLKPQTLFLGAVFAPIGLVANPQVVSVFLSSQQVNVEEQRRERDGYETPTFNQEKQSGELDENRPIEQMGTWGR